MRTRLINLWDTWRASYWFVPALTVSAALVFSLALSALNVHYDEWLEAQAPWLQMSAPTARLLLSTIAAAMTTIVGVVFSLTILTLSIATSQFGPRLLRSFLTSATTQFALGTFVATAIYCLVLLAMVRDNSGQAFVPYVPVSIAVALAIFNLAFLVYFIHNIAEMIQAPNVVRRVAADLDDSINRLYPDTMTHDDVGQTPTFDAGEGPPCFIRSENEGYLQGIDIESLCALAERDGRTFRVLFQPGRFIARNTPLLEVRPNRDLPEALSTRANEFFVFGNRRTPRQDVECAVAELVEVAVRALSPGINDPFTAITCVDRLGASLGRLAERRPRPVIHCGADGTVRVVVTYSSFGDVLNSGFDQIRQHGGTNAAVLIRLLEALTEVAQHALRNEDLAAVQRQMEMVLREARESIAEPNDLQDIEARVEGLTALLAR